MKLKMVIKNLFTDLSNYEVIIAPEYASEAETETDTETRLVVGIETPLDIISIVLQDRRERNQEDSSKQKTSVTPPLVKGTEPPATSQWA